MPNKEQNNTEKNEDINIDNVVENVAQDLLVTFMTTATAIFKQKLGKSFDSGLKDSEQESKKLSLLKYDEVIKYFIEANPNDPAIIQGAIIKEKQGSDYLILQIFLTEDYQMVSSPSGTI